MKKYLSILASFALSCIIFACSVNFLSSTNQAYYNTISYIAFFLMLISTIASFLTNKPSCITFLLSTGIWSFIIAGIFIQDENIVSNYFTSLTLNTDNLLNIKSTYSIFLGIYFSIVFMLISFKLENTIKDKQECENHINLTEKVREKVFNHIKNDLEENLDHYISSVLTDKEIQKITKEEIEKNIKNLISEFPKPQTSSPENKDKK